MELEIDDWEVLIDWIDSMLGVDKNLERIFGELEAQYVKMEKEGG